MFTGLIQQTGRLEALTRSGGGWRLRVRCAPWSEGLLVLGESVAVQGACLTVVEASGSGFAADVLDETLARTALARLRPGERVNLERALRIGDRLGGHIVSGHIDETGNLLRIENHGRDVGLTVSCSSALARMTVMKGSLAIDGVSLTVAGLGVDSVAVEIIPHTWQETSLSDRRTGDCVNLESDILGKHVARLLEFAPGSARCAKGGVDEDLLKTSGFFE